MEIIDSSHLIIGGPVGEQAMNIWEQVHAVNHMSHPACLFVVVFFRNRRAETWAEVLMDMEADQAQEEIELKKLMSLLLTGYQPFGVVELSPNPEHAETLTAIREWLFSESQDEEADFAWLLEAHDALWDRIAKEEAQLN